MTIEQDVRTALLAWPAVTNLVAQKVYIDEVPQTDVPPFVVYAKPAERIDRGLDGSVHARQARVEIQCVGGDRPVSIALRNAVVAALEAVKQPPDETSSGFDSEAAAEVEVVVVDWWAD